MPADGWCEVGSHGKHKHVPSSPKPDRSFRKSPSAGPHVCVKGHLQEFPSLTLLPGTALACIYQNLDSSSAFSLAQTCQACSREFTQQKPELTRKCLAELAPSIVCNDKIYTEASDYTASPALEISLQWRCSPGDSLSRMHSLSQKPHFWESLWDAAWPTSVWSEVLADSLPVPDYTDDEGYSYGSNNVVQVDILIESSQKLYVSWDWLTGQLLKTFTDAFTKTVRAFRPSGDHTTVLKARLYRPAKDMRLQEIVLQSTTFRGPEYDDMMTHTLGPQNQYYYSDTLLLTPVLPSHMQRVTVTGPWCHSLPDAKWPLCYAHFGHNMRAVVKGDRFSSDEPPRWYADFDEFLCLEDDYVFTDDGIVAEHRLKPFTCEVDVEPHWFNY